MKRDTSNESVDHGHGFDPQAGSDLTARPWPPAPSVVDGAIETRELRDALACFATGITVVTTRAKDGQVAGVTANSFCSVSLDPPLVLWCLSKSAPSGSVFIRATHFAIHVLAEDQADLSARFSRPSKDKFAGLQLSEGLAGTPLLEGAAAIFECRCEHRYEGGDHLIMVGKVERYRHTDRLPLLFHFGRYCGVDRR
jgi:flavin reductase (DIM6/NTAB) family NADH-FMN oxidoreductase RutF